MRPSSWARPVVAGVLGLVLLTSAAAGQLHIRTGGSVQTSRPSAAAPEPVSDRSASSSVASARVATALRTQDLDPGSEVRPVRITAEAVGIDAPVGPVGVDERGQLEVFDDVVNVGWYRHGPTPGEAGSAVLAAHVDHWREGAGVFFRLGELEEGDHVRIELDDGSALRFRVVSSEQFPRDELPSKELFRRAGDPVLTLITCGGRFDEDRRAYDDNVVVRAVPG